MDTVKVRITGNWTVPMNETIEMPRAQFERLQAMNDCEIAIEIESGLVCVDNIPEDASEFDLEDFELVDTRGLK